MLTQRIWKLLTVALAMSAAVITTSASASAGPVNRALTGGFVDPMATTLKVVPPKGGMVVLHQNGKAVAWFMRAGFVNLQANRIYSITATRGSSMLFNGNVMMRRGYTEAIWGQGNAPQMSYVPSFNQGWRQPAAARQFPSSGGRARMPGNTQRLMMSTLRGQRSDRQRWRTMTSYEKRYSMSLSQRRAAARTFKTKSYRQKAEHKLGVKKTASTPANKTASSKQARTRTKTTAKRSRARRSKSTTAKQKRTVRRRVLRKM